LDSGFCYSKGSFFAEAIGAWTVGFVVLISLLAQAICAWIVRVAVLMAIPLVQAIGARTVGVAGLKAVPLLLPLVLKQWVLLF